MHKWWYIHILKCYTVKYTEMLYSENEITILQALTRSQNYNIEWKKQITTEYIEDDTIYIKF